MTTASASVQKIADDLKLRAGQVQAAVRLLDGGATVPFIARYRKEQTGGLDEVELRAIEEKNVYYTDICARREVILSEVRRQGHLTADLEAQIRGCWLKAALEDLYLPFKPKRRTRAKIARERGLLPLALRIMAQPLDGDPVREAQAYVAEAREVPDVSAALAGARDIVAEILADRGDLRGLVRDALRAEGELTATAIPAKTKVPTKFETYYDYHEPLRALPSHRYLAIRRGEEEGVLRLGVRIDMPRLVARAAALVRVTPRSAFSSEYSFALEDALARLVCPSIETELHTELKQAADIEAIRIFAENLQKVLLQPALGQRSVLGIDPGQRTGCKCVVVDATGKLVHHTLINLVAGDAAVRHAEATIRELYARYEPFAVAVGNGTHGRETAAFCREIAKSTGPSAPTVVLVNESGASVYSASDIAREEFPDLDLTVRGAVSIARRLQDPLAELVKLDPKVIGVGQYQHDVSQPLLKRKLDEVVESCVSAVGVELNTASAALLAHVAGVGEALAKKIVKYREVHGAFLQRKDLLKVPSLGPKAFEQCAGFIRVADGAEPLDASAVHPERYALVAKAAKAAKLRVPDLLGHPEVIARVPWASYASADIGLPTLEDIQRELAKPGRDPRSAFEAPAFREDIRTLGDLKPGMALEGVITNVTAFGAFVDIGVHQDGLVHISQLADRFVKDPNEVAKVGAKIRVFVLEVDIPRQRIALSARAAAPSFPEAPLGDPARAGSVKGRPAEPRVPDARAAPQRPPQAFVNDALAKLGKRPG